jgi:ubiquinone/menaquinone biosynthesis C-methylase UbiE
MVTKARKNIAKAGLSNIIEVKEGTASRLPFSEGFFDIVVSTGSMHHWKEPIVGLNETRRRLS